MTPVSFLVSVRYLRLSAQAGKSAEVTVRNKS
jgi:hypothetical protein